MPLLLLRWCHVACKGRGVCRWWRSSVNWLEMIIRSQLWAAWPPCWAALGNRKQQQLCCPAGSGGPHCLVAGGPCGLGRGQLSGSWGLGTTRRTKGNARNRNLPATQSWGGPRVSGEVSPAGARAAAAWGLWDPQSLAKAPDPLCLPRAWWPVTQQQKTNPEGFLKPSQTLRVQLELIFLSNTSDHRMWLGPDICTSASVSKEQWLTV